MEDPTLWSGPSGHPNGPCHVQGTRSMSILGLFLAYARASAVETSGGSFHVTLWTNRRYTLCV